MARKDKVLDILALSGLPEDAKIARLASMKRGRLPTLDHARAVINCYFEQRGRTQELTKKLFHEAVRQGKLRDERKAFKAAAELLAVSPMKKFKPELVGEGVARKWRKRRILEIAKRTFGDAVRENFNADTLALMSLISGEDRWYAIRWKDAGFKPVRSVTIEVATISPSERAQTNRFLLYKANGRVLVARTKHCNMTEAWGYQLPKALVAAAPLLKGEGYSFKSDLEGQQMVVLSPDGSEFRRVPWEGRTVDD
jgi:hypothetical protein